VRRAPKGTLLAVEGKVMDGLYISLTGQLEVSAGDGRPTELHGAGSIFGQSSLLSRSVSEITVRTMSHMIVLRLSTQAFHSIAMQHPSMLAHLSDLSTMPIAKVTT
jgi:CRP-like cAMP-binding protein